MKKTKIICSIGPASDTVETMEPLVRAGMNCARINFSHATEESILNAIEVVREVRKKTRIPVAIMYDTKGPEFRTLDFEGKGISLNAGDLIKMVKDKVLGNKERFSVNHPEVISKIPVGSKMLVDDGLMGFNVVDKTDDYILLQATNSGMLKNHKSINIPGTNLGLTFMSEQDIKDIEFAAKHSCDYLSLSFVNSKEDVLQARRIIDSAGGDARIISKIENQTGVDNIEEILEVSDGIMIGRGDLGLEISLEELPVIQKNIIRMCRENGKFAIVATEMLASMYINPRPTRAEVSDIANAVLDGTDCVMLSGETTIGKYPTQAVKYMATICERIESTIDYSKHFEYKRNIDISDTIAKLVVDAVEYDDIKLIVTTTMTGFTARRISNLRPNCPIMACCPSNHIAEKVNLNFGIKPVVTPIYHDTDTMIEEAKSTAVNEFNLHSGDKIIITGGFPLGISKTTNYLRIVEV